MKAFLALRRFRAGASFRPWLLRIVANEAVNRRRAARRQAVLTLRATQGRPEEDAAPSPEGAALAREDQERLLRALGALRPEDRLVIAYRYWFELSQQEMAEAMGCRRGTVKSRLARALARLRGALAAATGGPEVPETEGAP